jgi:hypothetical protein
VHHSRFGPRVAAAGASGEERIALVGKVAGSVKRFGNQLDERQITALAELAGTTKGPEATAAAALMGALNLSNNRLVPLILGSAK